jgi:D-alanine-D-alanine ligase
VDYSPYLIEHASKQAEKNNYPIRFIQADARNPGLLSGSFDHVIIMGNSLGYISDLDADREILSEANCILRSGGWLLADITNGEIVKNTFTPNSWHEIGDDMVVCRERELHGERLHAREMVISKHHGIIRDETYAVRLYEPLEFESLLEDVGFKNVKVYKDLSSHQAEGDYGFMNSRMFASGQKQ